MLLPFNKSPKFVAVFMMSIGSLSMLIVIDAFACA